MDFEKIRKLIDSSLRLKILIPFMTIIALATIILFTTDYIIVRNNTIGVVKDELKTNVDTLYDLVEMAMSDHGTDKPAVAKAKIDFLKKKIKEKKYGELGYAFVITGEGDTIIHPTHEGKNILHYDFIKEILKKKNGTHEYIWEGKKKIIAFRHYAPMDWIIAAGSYYEDFLNRSMKKILLISIIIIISLTIIVFIVAYASLSLIIINPINRVKKIAEGIRAGDLTMKIEKTSNDEIGVMVDSISAMLSAQKEIVLALKEHIDNLTNASHGMEDISHRISTLSQDQASAMEETSAALEETLASMGQINTRAEQQYNNVDKNAERMANMAKDANNSFIEAESVGKLMTKTAVDARDGEEDLNKMVVEIQNIKDSTSKIEEIIKIISDISDQVNLLSLNAAIEAARAGEQGKGFAVVADEISKLAEETADSAKTITNLVREGNERVDAGTEIVNRTAQAFHKIIESIETVAGSVTKFSGTLKMLADIASEARGRTDTIKQISNEVSVSTKEQMTTNKEISHSIEKVNEGSQELVSYAESILKMSTEIKKLASTIGTQIGRFRIQ